MISSYSAYSAKCNQEMRHAARDRFEVLAQFPGESLTGSPKLSGLGEFNLVTRMDLGNPAPDDCIVVCFENVSGCSKIWLQKPIFELAKWCVGRYD